jgi:hypothetical protein
MQVTLVPEGDVRRLQAAVLFDIHLVEPVDEDVRDGRIRQQHLERPEAEELVQDVGDDRVALVEAERRLVALAIEHAADQRANLGFGVLALHARQAVEIQPVQQLLVDAALEVLVSRAPGGGGHRSRFHDSGRALHRS